MSMHPSMQRAAAATWDPVAALFSLLLRPPSPSRRLALDNVLLLMQVAPAGEDDKLAKAALYTKYTETLPAAVRRWRQLGVPLLLELLGGMRAAVEGCHTSSSSSGGGGGSSSRGGSSSSGGGGGSSRSYPQHLFAQAQCFLQVCNVLNEEYPQECASELCCCVLDTLSSLLAGNPANRRALTEKVGYGMLLEALVKRLGGQPPPHRLLLCVLGLMLEEAPGPGAAPRFSSSSIDNPAALPLLLALLRRAAPENQLWGLAALRELLLQGVHNLAAADSAGLNTLLITWLTEAVAAPAAAAAAAAAAAVAAASPEAAAATVTGPAAATICNEDGAAAAVAEGGKEGEQQEQQQRQQEAEEPQLLMLLQQQLLALLRLSGSYSISARELRSLLQLLKPPGPGSSTTPPPPPPHSRMLLEALTEMASHEGPSCFFNFNSGTSSSTRSTSSSGQQSLPSGILCAANLGGGGSSSSSALRMPRNGYSFAAWVRLEDGREAAEQLQAVLPAQLAHGAHHQHEHPSPAAAAAAAAAAALSSDQAIYSLLHQQQPSGGGNGSQQQQVLQGVALAVRHMTAAGSGGQQQQLLLVAHCWSPKHLEAPLLLQQQLLPGRWHHVALTHTAGGALSHPVLQAYLDGQQQAGARLRYPALKEPLTSVCLGAGGLLRPLQGQAGAAFFFDDVLAPGQVAALHQLGPDYQSPLNATESSGLLDQHPAAAAALALGTAAAAAAGGGASSDGGPAAATAAVLQGQPPKLLLAFCPQAAEAAAGSASSSSSSDRKGSSRGIRDAVVGAAAALLPGTQLCRTQQPQDMLHCLGGVAVLLPLLEQGQQQHQGGSSGGAAGVGKDSSSTAAAVLRLLAAMLRGSPTNQQAMQQIGGFALVAHLLEQQQQQLTAELLSAQQQLLGAVSESQDLTQDVLRHLLLNLRLWSTAAPPLQHKLLSLWRQLAQAPLSSQGEPLLVHRLLPPARLLHHVRRCYFSGGRGSSGGGGGSKQLRRRSMYVAAGLGEVQEQREQQEPEVGEGAPLPPVAPAPGLLQQQQEAAAAAAAAAAELRRGYLQLACIIVTEAAAAASRPAAAGAAAGTAVGAAAAAAGGDEIFIPDLHAIVALLADCCTSITASSSSSGGGSSSSGSSSDVVLLQELLSLLLLPLLRRRSLARLPLLACLQQQGGPPLLLPLLRLEQQQLRLLGLRAITACLPDTDSSSSSSSGGGGNGDRGSSNRWRSLGSRAPWQQQQQQLVAGPSGAPGALEVIAAAGELLGSFPLTAATRIALFEMMCDGTPWPQIDSLAPAGPAAAGAAAAAGLDVDEDAAASTAAAAAAAGQVRVRHPAAAAVLLQMAAAPTGGGGSSSGERAAVLGMLCLLCESASLAQQGRQVNQDLLQAMPCCWQQLLLDCLRTSSGSSSSSSGGNGSISSSSKGSSGGSSGGSGEKGQEQALQAAAAAAAAWRLLVLLLARGLAASSSGWQQLQVLVSLLKAQPDCRYWCPGGSGGSSSTGSPSHAASGGRASSSGSSSSSSSSTCGSWQLLQELLADIMQELLAAQAADAAAGGGSSSISRTSSSGGRGWAVSPRAAAAASTAALTGGRQQQQQQQVGRTSSEWEAWTLVSQWSTQPYCSNAAALLSLLDDFLAGVVLPPPGGSLSPSGSALLWAGPAAAAGGGGVGADSIPHAAWQELGALPKQQQQRQQQQQQQGLVSSRLLLAAWRFLDRLHTSGAAAAAAAEAAYPRSPAAASDTSGDDGGGSSAARRQNLGQGSSSMGEAAADAAAAAGGRGAYLSEQQLVHYQQQRGLLLLQRLLLLALHQLPPEVAQQAAAQAAQLLPLLLADAAADQAAAEAAVAHLQLLLAAVVQCYRGITRRAAAAQQQEQLLPLQLQQRLAACIAAANAVVSAAPGLFGLPSPPQQQQQQQQYQQRLVQELLPLLQPRLVVAAARQQLLFMRHCAAVHQAGVPVLQQQLQGAAGQQRRRVAAAEEASGELLGSLLAADRLRRAATRQAAEERQQAQRRQWRDLRRGLTSGRGLWAEEESAEDVHWKLDGVEDPSRRRLRLRRNFHFQRYSDPPKGGGGSAGGAASSSGGGAGAAADAEAAASGGSGSSGGGSGEAELLALAKLVVPGSNPQALAEEPAASDEEEVEGAGQEEGGSSSSKAGSTAREAVGQQQQEQQEQALPVQGSSPRRPPPPARRQQRQHQQQQEAEGASPSGGPTVWQEQQQQQPPPFRQQYSEDAETAAAAAAGPAAGAAAGAASETVLFSSRCQWVTPKRVLPGQLRITPTQLHFIADVAAAPAAGTAGSSSSGAGHQAASAAGQAGGGTAGAASTAAGTAGQEGAEEAPRRRHQRWPVGGVTEVHHSRFLLQPTALECFMADRASHALLNFPTNQAMKDAAAALLHARPAIAVYDRRRKGEWAVRLQHRWLRWEISTFDYLMALNTLAGRTYTDLNQYPVMPWVLADYSSPTLDLNDPATFRDLSKPIGALNDKRLDVFLERYEGLRNDPDMPPFYYGSHYSNAGMVLFYLIRMEGFTKLNRALQGGRFDHGDRLFHSIASTWQNCLENTADVKELVPEFYYQPEFLLNANRFNLGTKQDGVPLGDVVLPPWANGSADEFVRIMREALESEHVSQNLHQWIDLIFGCKQRGKAAEEALNVFYYLTYEGTVDLDSIQDATLRAAVEDQIRHFGQTPMQLFRRRHPRRGVPPPPYQHPLLNGPDAMRRSALALPSPARIGVPLSQLWVLDGRILQLHADRAVSSSRWFATSRPDLGAFTFSTSLLPDASSASIEPDPLPPRPLAGAWGAAHSPLPGLAPQQQQYALLHGDRVVLSGGYWDGSLRAHSSDNGRLLQSLHYHQSLVTCLAASSDGRIVVTGSGDTTLMVWDANPASTRVVRGRQPLPMLPRPRCSLYGHRDTLTCVAVSLELDLVVSGAADGTLLLHSLGTGSYVRSLALPHSVPPALLCIVPKLGALLVHSHTDLQLHLYNVNCRHLVSADTHERLASVCPTLDGRLLLAAGTSGLVTLRWLHSLQVVLRYDGCRGPITSLAITPEDCFLAGTAEGSVVLFAPDPRRRITRRFNLADARPALLPPTTTASSSISSNINGSNINGDGGGGGGNIAFAATEGLDGATDANADADAGANADANADADAGAAASPAAVSPRSSGSSGSSGSPAP